MSAPCCDCGRDTAPRAGDFEWYMVHDDVWRATQPWNEYGGEIRFLCIGCLERRLGRRLASADFSDALVNDPNRADSARLAERKGQRERRAK